MAKTYPIHPQDLEMLTDIRRYLIGHRITNGWTQAELSRRINGTEGGVWALEKGDFQWRLSRLQSWMIPFGRKLIATPLFPGLVSLDGGSRETWQDVIDFDPRVEPLRVAAEQSEQWPVWQRAYLTSYLRVAREVQGITQDQLATELGISKKAISHWEVDSDEILLLKMLAHARALGGTIKLAVS